MYKVINGQQSLNSDYIYEANIMSNNSTQKNFQSNSKGLTAPPTLHEELAVTTQRLFDSTEGFPRRFWIKTSGDLVIKDAEGVSATYPVLASQPFVFENCTEIEATSSVSLIIQW